MQDFNAIFTSPGTQFLNIVIRRLNAIYQIFFKNISLLKIQAPSRIMGDVVPIESTCLRLHVFELKVKQLLEFVLFH